MIALALAAALAPVAPSLPAKLAPIDECSADDSFALFRDTLTSAANREDREALAALVAPELRVAAALEDHWPRLRMLLRMGCVRAGTARIMPSTPKQIERLGPDSRKGKFLALPGSDLLETTEDPNSVVDGAVLKWDIVTATNLAGHVWTGVTLADGRSGFILDADLYSLEFPASITVEQRDGQWMISRFE